MPQSLRSLMLVALCLASGSFLPALETTVVSAASPASPANRQQTEALPQTGRSGDQQVSADSQRQEPATLPDNKASAKAQTAQKAETHHVLPPLRELITSPFGNRRMPGWLSRRGMVMRNHGGIDIRAHKGWPVTAFKPGTVVRAGENGPLGISVDIRQGDGMTARYGHMAKALVKTGQHVEAGEPVGLVGCTGRTTGAHLHFGLLNASGKAVDPMPYLHSADEVLRPDPAQIPEVIEAQSCGPVLRGPNGRPTRLGNTLKNLDNYTPPPIPAWNKKP